MKSMSGVSTLRSSVGTTSLQVMVVDDDTVPLQRALLVAMLLVERAVLYMNIVELNQLAGLPIGGRKINVGGGAPGALIQIGQFGFERTPANCQEQTREKITYLWRRS